MTFPENTDNTLEQVTRTNMNSGEAMKAILTKALVEGRVTYGAFECAQLLQEVDPDYMNMCILPVSPIQEDIDIRIQHTLIQAFCWENDIKLVKVDTMQKLAKILTPDENAANNNDTTSADFSCVLVKNCETNESSDNLECDPKIQKLIDNYHYPIIELPE